MGGGRRGCGGFGWENYERIVNLGSVSTLTKQIINYFQNMNSFSNFEIIIIIISIFIIYCNIVI